MCPFSFAFNIIFYSQTTLKTFKFNVCQFKSSFITTPSVSEVETAPSLLFC